MLNYGSGVFECELEGSDEPPDHVALIVGYTEDYWVLKNSWGEQWG